MGRRGFSPQHVRPGSPGDPRSAGLQWPRGGIRVRVCATLPAPHFSAKSGGVIEMRRCTLVVAAVYTPNCTFSLVIVRIFELKDYNILIGLCYNEVSDEKHFTCVVAIPRYCMASAQNAQRNKLRQCAARKCHANCFVVVSWLRRLSFTPFPLDYRGRQT